MILLLGKEDNFSQRQIIYFGLFSCQQLLKTHESKATEAKTIIASCPVFF